MCKKLITVILGAVFVCSCSWKPAINKSLHTTSLAKKIPQEVLLYSQLCEACGKGQKPLVNSLLTKGIDLDGGKHDEWMMADYLPYGSLKPINSAAHAGELEIVKTLVEKGAKVDNIDGQGATALIFALQAGHLETAEYLIESGASKTQQCDFGTPLEIAKQQNASVLVRMLESE